LDRYKDELRENIKGRGSLVEERFIKMEKKSLDRYRDELGKDIEKNRDRLFLIHRTIVTGKINDYSGGEIDCKYQYVEVGRINGNLINHEEKIKDPENVVMLGSRNLDDHFNLPHYIYYVDLEVPVQRKYAVGQRFGFNGFLTIPEIEGKNSKSIDFDLEEIGFNINRKENNEFKYPKLSGMDIYMGDEIRDFYQKHLHNRNYEDLLEDLKSF